MIETLRRLAPPLLIVTLAVSAYLATRYWQDTRGGYRRVASSEDCDLRLGSCTQSLGNGRVVFAITPSQIPLMQPLQLSVEVTGLAVDAVAVEIRGLNMDMGLNRTVLAGDAAGRWRGTAILPVCSQRRMQWEAAVRLDGTDRIELAFPFYTARP